MSTLREAAQQALEALQEYQSNGAPFLACDGAVAALKAALTQQDEPVEPVAWRTFDGEGGYDYRTYADNENYAAEWAQRNPRHVGWVEPLYTAPPRCPNCASLEAQNTELDRRLAELERAESAQEPVQEPVQKPVAWLYEAGADSTLHWNKPPLYGTPLYTAPPQRQPLTDEEIDRICASLGFAAISPAEIVRAVERAHGIGERP